MITSFSQSFQSEWLKKQHTTSSWMIWICAFFMPLIVLIVRLFSSVSGNDEVTSKNFWNIIHHSNWVVMGMFLLPLTLILATSPITSIEYKNNTWKQAHTTPQPFSIIFFSKLAVIITMVLQLLILFNVGIYLSAIIPSYIFNDVSFPSQKFTLLIYIKSSVLFIIDSLPILALQFLLSLHFKNFLVAIGIGFALLVVSLLALNWQYGYIMPFIYLPLNFEVNQNYVVKNINKHWCTRLIY